jgi:ribonuclease R
VHRLIDAWFKAIDADFSRGPVAFKQAKLQDIPTNQDLVMQGQHLSFTERKSEAAERELRQIKLLALMEGHIGEQFLGVVTSITKFGLFIQLDKWLIEGLVRYPELGGDFWEVDERGGVVKGRRTGQRIHIGDVVEVRIARVDQARRELDVQVIAFKSRGQHGTAHEKGKRPGQRGPSGDAVGAPKQRKTGGQRRAQKSRTRDKAKGRRSKKD